MTNTARSPAAPPPITGINMIKKTLITLALALALTSCMLSNPPAPSVSEYIQTKNSSFIIERQRDIRYDMSYMLRKELPQPIRYEVRFENPAPRGREMTVKGAIAPGENTFSVQSPVLPGIKNNTNYDVQLILITNNQIIAQHSDQVRFSISKSEESLLDLNIYQY
jgi:hypothetical protein